MNYPQYQVVCFLPPLGSTGKIIFKSGEKGKAFARARQESKAHPANYYRLDEQISDCQIRFNLDFREGFQLE
jgi:hypothetical protein